MKAALLVFTDGRGDCLQQTLNSLEINLEGTFAYRTIVDDSGESDYNSWLRHTFSDYHIRTHHRRLGFCETVADGWDSLPHDVTHFFHLEDDFEFQAPIPLETMASVLDRNPGLIQLAFKRQPWNEEERLMGDLVWQRPDAFKECSDDEGNLWVEHRLFFTTNPSLMRIQWAHQGWPEGPRCEGKYGLKIMGLYPDAHYGFWGAFTDGPKVLHVGHERVGTGY